jgi:hypothetical protein
MSAEEPAHRYLDYFHQVYQTLRSEYVESLKQRIFSTGPFANVASLDDPFHAFLMKSPMMN